MQITATMVKELRERTGAGMMECKKALSEAAGDIDAAIELLRTKGTIKAAKKSGRIAAEGLINVKVADDHASAVMTEINSETDFAARNEMLINFAEAVSATALSSSATTVEQLSEMTALDSGKTIEETRVQLVAEIGENISIRRFVKISTKGQIGAYVHGGRIGVLVELDGGDHGLAQDIAMHIVASNPEVIKPEDVSEDRIAREKEFLITQAQDSGKPAEIIEKMIEGRLTKFVDEISLMGQNFVKDPSITVASILRSANATIKSFTRYEVGEGIEKKEGNFADEVMAQVRGE